MEKEKELLRQMSRCTSAIDSLKNELIDLYPMTKSDKDLRDATNKTALFLDELRGYFCDNSNNLVF